MRLEFVINGQPASVDVPPMARLLDVLREDLRLTGSKEGCGEGECGACTVLIDGEPVNSCLVPAVQVAGTRIETVEGLGAAGGLDAVQQAFLRCGAAQCGICTPGFLVMATALLRRKAQPSRAEAREALAGNLCRCTGYQKIIDAVVTAVAENDVASNAAAPESP